MTDRGEDIFLVDEAHLGVELHEFELAVGTQVLVAQTASDLVVAVDAADHAELLEQLRALGKGVERARLLTGGHDEVARPFGGGRNQHRGLDLDEALLLHAAAHGGVHGGAGAKVVLHALLAQVDVPVTQTDGLIDLGALVEGERRWFSLGQNLDLDHLDLDLARSEITVGGVVGPQAYLAGHLHHVLAAEVVARVDDTLHDTGAVAQIDEREVLAVLATAVDPAAHGDRPAGVGSRQLAAHVGAHRGGVILHVLVIPGRWEKGLLKGGYERRRVTCSARSTRAIRCWPVSPRRSRRVTSPLATSSSPMMAANGAPERSATFIWAFIERPP